MRAGVTAIILVLALSAHAGEQSSSRATDDSVGQSVTDAARAVGHATRDVAKETGQAVAAGAKDAKKAVSSDAGHDKDGKKTTDNPAGKTK